MRQGRELWNNARDRTSQPGTEIPPPFYFADGQSAGTVNADVLVIADATIGAAEASQAHPSELRLNPNWWATLSADEKAAIIAHELAHPRGLANANVPGSGCQVAWTIMQGIDLQGQPQILTVQERDVFQMNQYFNNPGGCCADYTNPTTLTCPDTDGDGVTVCEGDCNDNNPAQTFDCGSCDASQESQCYAAGGAWDSANCSCSYGCDPGAEAQCYSSGGTWDAFSCSCTPYSGCDPYGFDEQACLNNSGSWDPSNCECDTATTCVMGAPQVVSQTYYYYTVYGWPDGEDCVDITTTYRQCCEDGTNCVEWETFDTECCIPGPGGCY